MMSRLQYRLCAEWVYSDGAGCLTAAAYTRSLAYRTSYALLGLSSDLVSLM